MQSESLNYYEILEIEQSASTEVIFEAYQKALKTYSLDNAELYKVFSPDEAQAWIDLIEEAYSIVGSPNTRRAYDLELSEKIQPTLPSFDFNNTESEKTEEEIVEEVPEGFAITKISQFKINPKFEEQIAKQEVFDGLFLKKIREYKNIDLTDFSKYTCIAIRHLYAIENNNFSVLPAPVFVRGYVIQYCRTLDLDEKLVVSSFMNLLNEL